MMRLHLTVILTGDYTRRRSHAGALRRSNAKGGIRRFHRARPEGRARRARESCAIRIDQTEEPGAIALREAVRLDRVHAATLAPKQDAQEQVGDFNQAPGQAPACGRRARRVTIL